MTTVIQGSAAELRTAVRVFEMIAAAGDKAFRARVKQLADAQGKLEATQAAFAKAEATQNERAEELARRTAAFDGREASLTQRQGKLEADAAALQARIAAADAAAAQRDVALSEREDRIGRQETALAEARAALDETQGVLRPDPQKAR